MYSIGQFSRITGLTIKSLHLYHEKKILIPRLVDPFTNYRYYDSRNLDLARMIRYLRELRVPLDEIREIIESSTNNEKIFDLLKRHKEKIQRQIADLNQTANDIDNLIAIEKQAYEAVEVQKNPALIKNVSPVLVAGYRWKGRYEETGIAFSQLFKNAGRIACGAPFNIYYDEGYMEEGADIESCVPVKKKKEINDEGFSLRELPGGEFMSYIYQGPYDQINTAYSHLAEIASSEGSKLGGPAREIYLKGPGIIFKGNPKKYVTELQFPVM
jgi:DNA-binding transcriptional MerR regulator